METLQCVVYNIRGDKDCVDRWRLLRELWHHKDVTVTLPYITFEKILFFFIHISSRKLLLFCNIYKDGISEGQTVRVEG